MRFEKWEGLGNDFVLIRAEHEDAVGAEEAQRLCDRRFGIGADGVLLVLPPTRSGAQARMRVLNADGSAPEMCGNGLRCVMFHVTQQVGPQPQLTIETDAGLRSGTFQPGAHPSTVLVDMGPVRVMGQRPLDTAGSCGVYTLVDAGNPHAVTFGTFDPDTIRRLGPAVATHPSFPHGTNVEFATPTASGVDLTVWERGVGLTLACGTGACATVAAGCTEGLWSAGTPITVRLPGGALRVTIDHRGHALMEGPARKVYDGVLSEALSEDGGDP